MNKLLTISLLFAATTFGQSRCDSAITDDANVLNESHVTSAVNSLQAAGADVRIWAFNQITNGNMDLMKAMEQKICPSWQAADGGMKNNLIVLTVAVKDHKVGFYYGSQWKPVLDSQWNRIETEQMKPRFRDKDFTGGFVAAAERIQKLIAEYGTAGTGTGTAVVVQQSAPIDYDGMGRVIGMILLCGVGCLLIYALVVFLGRRREREEAIVTAKQRAVIAQQEIVGLLAKLTADYPAFEVLTTDKGRVGRCKALLDAGSTQYAALKQSSTADPNQDGLTAGQYQSIAESYERILSTLRSADALMRGIDQAKVKNSHKQYKQSEVRNTPAQPTPAPQAATQQTNTTVYAPVTVVEDRAYYDPWPSRTPDPPSHESGGGSSSWGSSDSGSGGSSDWGSSSSDSGGSSDFGSSDSGGGGSSDF